MLSQVSQMDVVDVDKYAPLTGGQAIEAFKVQLRINLDKIDLMLSDPKLTKGKVYSEQKMREVYMRVMVENSKANDQLFEETGV